MKPFGIEEWRGWHQQGYTRLPAVRVERGVSLPEDWEKLTQGVATVLLETAQSGRYSFVCGAPERVIIADWGLTKSDTVYPVDIFISANDRQGLLRDISEVFSRDKINVIGVNTQSAKGVARMVFTAEIGSTAILQKALAAISEVAGVLEARRQ